MRAASKRSYEKEVAEIKADIARIEGGQTMVHKKVELAKEVMNENRRLAIERGEKLAEMQEKSAGVEDGARNFANMAEKLKNQQKNSWF